MGVAQARILSVQVIVFFFLMTSVAAQLSVPIIPEGDGACCIPRYAGSLEFISESLTQTQGINYCNQFGADYIANCFSNGALVNEDFSYSGCCCDTEFNIPLTSESPDFYVSKTYCGIQDQNIYNYRGEGTCQEICGAGTKDFYSVYGVVRHAQTQQPLDDIQVLTSEGITTQTEQDGSFEFGSHLFEAGVHSFTFSSPTNYALVCETQSVEQNINSNNFFIPINLNCIEIDENSDECVPNYQVLVDGVFVDIDEAPNQGWSNCQQIGTEFLRTREVKDGNSCEGSSDGIEYDASGCSEEVIDQDCNGVYTTGEFCDGSDNSFTFLINGKLYENVNSVSCEEVYAGFSGEILCNSCKPTIDVCEAPSDCSVLDDCEKVECAQNPLCLGCDKTLAFIPEDAPTTDLFDLYDYMATADSRFPLYPVEYHQGTKDVTVHWTYDLSNTCSSDLFGFDILVCKEGSAGNCDFSEQVHIESTTDISLNSLRFENVLEEEFTSYCYNVIARTGTADYPAFEEGNLPCFETGSLSCMQPQAEGRNCIYVEEGSGPSYCELYSNTLYTNQQLQYQLCGIGTECVETATVPGSNQEFKQGAACVPKQVCDSCNGMFGLFASYNLPAISEGGTSEFMCQDLLFVSEVGSETPGQDSSSLGYGQCYLDESPTLFSYYKECEQVTSCYDYASKASCGSDPCFKFTNVISNENGIIQSIDPASGCQWQEFADEVGVGVCQPKEIELQDCSLCDTNSSLGFCSKDMCGLYGSCFYKQEETIYQQDAFAFQDRVDKVPACLHIDDMSCALYDTVDECIGIAEERNLPTVDILYHGLDLEEDARLLGEIRLNDLVLPTARIAGNNKQMGRSNDLLGFGDCRWDALENRCFKDSNGFVGNIITDDCDEDPSIPCYKDNEPPQTILNIDAQITETINGEELPLYGSGELFDINIVVRDEYSTPEEIRTYFSFLPQSCIEQEISYVPCLEEGQTNCISSASDQALIEDAYRAGCYIYPQYTVEELKEQFDRGELSFETGIYTLLYFSEDNARNVEEIRAIKLAVDGTNPLIEISEPQLDILNPYEDIFLTDLSFDISVYEDSECQVQLYESQNVEEPIHPGTLGFSATNTPYTTTISYPQLEDGSYNFIVKCLDDFKNLGFENQEFLINSDSSITPLYPLKQVFTSVNQVELGISAAFEGTCKFDLATQDFGDSFSSSRFTFDAQGQQTDGRYLYTATIPESIGSTSGIYLIQPSCAFNTGEITEHRVGDILSYAIDDLSPQGSILEQEEDYSGSTSPWQNSRSLEIVCDDTSINTPSGYNTGCSTIHICISTQVSMNTFNQEGSETICSGKGNEYRTYSGDGPADNLRTTIDLTKDQYEYTYIHYFFEDAGGARSRVFTANTKVRNTDISEPLVEID